MKNINEVLNNLDEALNYNDNSSSFNLGISKKLEQENLKIFHDPETEIIENPFKENILQAKEGKRNSTGQKQSVTQVV